VVRKLIRPRFLLSSYILGAAAAFSSAALLDYLYFDQAVQARETVIRRTHREVLKRHDDYLHADCATKPRRLANWRLPQPPMMSNRFRKSSRRLRAWRKPGRNSSISRIGNCSNWQIGRAKSPRWKTM
jgi:hypothetical protein